ncbi:HAD family hydrolase [Litoreibacter ponti]|nr:HAD family hydrolase [Litoreibacter ponti]
MHKFDLVIFDCDGVLVDSEPITNRLMQEDLARHGLVLSLDDVLDQFVGGTMRGVMDKANAMGANLPIGWVDQFYAQMFERLAAEVEVIPGAPAVLDALDAAGLPYAVGSNGPHAKMDITLRRTGLFERLQGRVYSREDVALPKPAPDVYLKAAADAGVAPDRCAVVEDSPTGAAAGKAAGMTVFGFAAEMPRARLLPICDHVFEDMLELPELLSV